MYIYLYIYIHVCVCIYIYIWFLIQEDQESGAAASASQVHSRVCCACSLLLRSQCVWCINLASPPQSKPTTISIITSRYFAPAKEGNVQMSHNMCVLIHMLLFALILLYMCTHSTLHVPSYHYFCPHTSMREKKASEGIWRETQRQKKRQEFIIKAAKDVCHLLFHDSYPNIFTA